MSEAMDAKLRRKGFVIDNVRLFTKGFPDTIDYAFPMTIFGPVKSGKSWLVRFLIEYFLVNNIVTAVYIFTGATNDDYTHLYNTGTVFYSTDGPADVHLSNIIDTQDPTKLRINGKLVMKKKPPIMIIFDDVLNSFPRETVPGKRSMAEQMRVKNTIQDLYTKMRHYNIFPVTVAQQGAAFPKYVLGAVGAGFSFCFNPSTKENAGMAKNLIPPISGYSRDAAMTWFTKNRKAHRHMWVFDGPEQVMGEFKVGEFKVKHRESWPLDEESDEEEK